ncbi:protein-tyrosine-phosphatase MKP1-like [Rutidosis leptorrhynchoides]|uniref:protein-tyrosine-phosphatase MKP1-like n=1 Tax=Rutidosis leptorrhynchoides TaxID=125765 RepID=UPI003A98D787
MLGEKDDNFNSPPPPPPLLPAAVDEGTRKTSCHSVSWAGSSPVISKHKSTKSRACLPPLSISRPKAKEWPMAGPDDLGIWPNIPTTPRAIPKPEFEFKKDKLAHFDKECSRIIDHVFLGSDYVAKNLDVLRENGITHVLNCVGFVCPEYFKKDLEYKTLWLQDTPSEDITSILYDVFDYFEDVREQKGRIFVHCCKGVSRSTSLVIAYLMWVQRFSFEEALQQVKTARGVTDPNMGFACQLLNCQKRVHNAPMSPKSAIRMFRIAPHSSYDPLHLVPKLLTQPNLKALDSRGAFIVHVPDNIYVWIGKNCLLLMFESAILAASQVIRYEKAIGPVLRVMEGEEPVEFWWAVFSEKENEMEVSLGEKRVVDYDLDFEIFEKAVDGGVVPPLTMVNSNYEMCLPVRQSGWERLRWKITNGGMKELIDYKESHDDNFECQLSESSSFVVKRLKKVH